MPTWSTDRVRATASRTGGDAARVYRVVMSRPSWVVKAAATLAAIVLVAMTLILVIPAVMIFIVVMVVGSLIERVRRMFTGGRSIDVNPRDGEGRRNVRVLTPRQSHT